MVVKKSVGIYIEDGFSKTDDWEGWRAKEQVREGQGGMRRERGEGKQMFIGKLTDSG